MSPAEVTSAVQTGLDQYSQVDSVTLQPETTNGGKKILNVNITGGVAALAVELDPANDGVLVYGTPDGGTTQNPLDTNFGAAGNGTLRVVPDNFTSTTITNIETFTGATWEALGKPQTTVVDDGDLRTVDTEAEALAVNPTANAAGAASVKYSIAFLLRWLIKLKQGAIVAGSNIIGKVGIDQTTPGTTNFVQNKQMPDATATFSTDSVTSSALEASGVIKAGPGTLYGFSGYSALAAGQFILLFNSTTVPVDTTVPSFTPIAVNANGNFSVDFGTYGKHFSTGISWSNSSTAATKTIGAADCFVSAEIK